MMVTTTTAAEHGSIFVSPNGHRAEKCGAKVKAMSSGLAGLAAARLSQLVRVPCLVCLKEGGRLCVTMDTYCPSEHEASTGWLSGLNTVMW